MKNRVLTAVVGSVILIGWLFTMYTPAFAAILAVVCAIGVFEMTKAFDVKNPVFRTLTIIISAIIPFYFEYKSKLNIPVFPVITAIVLVSLIIMVLDFKKLKFEQIVSSLFSAFMIPSALSCTILFRDVYLTFPESYKKSDGIFLMIFAFFACWLSDIFALLCGMKFGKHKLAPEISPKKTVEGAVGGLICSTLINAGLFFVFKLKFDLTTEISLPIVIISSVILSVISVFGDLSASTIKRHHGIKDFGNLLPGHGGVMDRFDSTIFVFPALYAIISVVNVI